MKNTTSQDLASTKMDTMRSTLPADYITDISNDTTYSQFMTPSVQNASGQSCNVVVPSQFISNVIPAVYSIIFILGFIGNSVVIAVLCHRSHLKTVSNIYIINLSIADLVFLSTLPIWAVYYATGYSWHFGSVMCKICSSLVSLNLYASIYFITCMSFDRYMVILHPFGSQSEKSLCQARCVIILVWTLALVATFPAIYFLRAHYLENLGNTVCAMVYPPENSDHWSAAMSLMKNTLGFFIPFTVISACYGSVAYHLMRMDVREKNKRKRDKALWMVFAVVLAFFICWLPFHVLTFLDALSKMNFITNCRTITAIDTAMPIVICLGFANSCINPFIYYFMEDHFQVQLTDMAQSGSIKLYNRRNSSTRISSFSHRNNDMRDTDVKNS
ncbi:type-2 angiotensin II receptor [Chiloscyllium plagiosum]|uniref:type-2 angiotensin II receptor n=1 Tax=Chiloscyllium plagiosum TaxID=36176 RepID=UPI001CB7DB76|nr:type-2 angiotensin II receptor [Chiloscyllium plagiosum]